MIVATFWGSPGRAGGLPESTLPAVRSAFPPVELGDSANATVVDCLVNGPSTVLCILQARDPQTPAHAWLVNTDNGALLYDGPTGLRLQSTAIEPVVE